MPRKNNRTLQQEVNARVNHEVYVSNLQEGRKQRANVFASGKGKGAYNRKGKYGRSWED